jgi:hypothetical protein
MLKKENKTFSERIKLWIANKALRIAESMLALERPNQIGPNPPKEPTIEPVKPKPIPQELNVRENIDGPDWEELANAKGEQDMKDFYNDMVTMVAWHLEKKSALTVAGPLMAHALRIYKSVLSREDYEDIMRHIVSSGDMIEPLTLPQEEEKKKNTIH